MIDHQGLGGLARDILPQILCDERQGKVDPRRDARRGPDRSLADKDAVGLDPDLGIALLQFSAAGPVCGGALAVQQTGLSQQLGP